MTSLYGKFIVVFVTRQSREFSVAFVTRQSCEFSVAFVTGSLVSSVWFW